MSSNYGGGTLNVYSGADSLKNYYNPQLAPPLPLVEIPDGLNPYRGDNVRIFAKMMTMLPAHNIKELPALAMLSSDAVPSTTKEIVEYSSGSTVISMSIIARILRGIDDTKAYVSNKTSTSKLRLLQFFGLNVTLFGGPSQPEPVDVRGGIQRARKKAQESSDGISYNPNQYENDENWLAHERWTGPQILAQLPSISVMCCGLGTAGTMTGVASYLKKKKPSTFTLGVCTAPGQRVPGPRTYALLSPVKFLWRHVVDEIEQCGTEAAFTKSLQLSRGGLVCGPSSGFNLCGLLNFIGKRKADGRLDSLRGDDGNINCVFVCCDLPYQYIDEYFEKISSERFHPINSANLQNVDLYRYDEAWELNPQHNALDMILGPGNESSQVVLDLRNACDAIRGTFSAQMVVNLPLSSLHDTGVSPFYCDKTMEAQWTELNSIIGPKSRHEFKQKLIGKRVIAICYNGDTARVASSVLRASGIECFSVKGGTAALHNTAVNAEKVQYQDMTDKWSCLKVEQRPKIICDVASSDTYRAKATGIDSGYVSGI